MINSIKKIQKKSGFICDMDGVLYHGNRLLAGAKDFVDWLKSSKKNFLFLTNASQRSPKELKQKLDHLGISVGEEHFYTSAQATAGFLSSQMPGGSVYIIGEAGLINAMYDAGFSMNDINPDYVVMGESRSYNLETLERAVNLVLGGAKLIGTNPDVTGPLEKGLGLGTGALISPIELATGSKAYYVGKPNPLMMRQALKKIGCKREDTVIIGDRMDTDVIAGIESEIETVLVLTGVTTRENMMRFAYSPDHILDHVGQIAQAVSQ